jgi:hypothetical protein
MDDKTLILLVLGVLATLYLLSMVGSKEYYGGQVKNIKKIPFNDCVRIADTYLKSCLRDNKYANPGACYDRFGPQGWMVSECYYSNYQRM